MSRENGFLQLRRGIWQHIRDGRMSITEGLAFIYICSQADSRTGIWKGCAKSLSGELGIPDRTARDVLEKMEHGDYIRRFAVPGRHTCYPILIHKYPISQGEHDGEQLNALESKSPVDLSYFSREQSVEQNGEHGVEHGAAQRIQETRNKRLEKRKSAAAPPPDARYGPFLEFAKGSFEAKHKHPQTWTCFGRDGAALADFLRRAPHVTLDVWQTHILNFFDSTEVFTLKQGGSLSYFISRFDTFSSGPILEGGTNGSTKKLTGDALTRANLKAAGYVQ